MGVLTGDIKSLAYSSRSLVQFRACGMPVLFLDDPRTNKT